MSTNHAQRLAAMTAKTTMAAPGDLTGKVELLELLAGVSQEWAKGLDKRGKKGSDILAAFKSGLKN